LLRDAAHEVVDFGAPHLCSGDDYPDYVIPLARAVAAGTVVRGIALCGSGVGASICANKIAGVRAGRSGDWAGTGMGTDSDILEGSLQRRDSPPAQSRQSDCT
jgi:ribose 5-phosphate isomerase B